MPDLRLYGVVGRPIGHSLSPLIFRSLFAGMGLDAGYVRLAAADAPDALALAEAMGLEGLNVTAPFKTEIAAFLTELDGAAARLGAVNCLVRSRGSWQGRNTDCLGSVGALEEAGIRIRGRRAAVLGAGGAGRAAALGLLRRGAAEVFLANRSADRGRIAAARVGCRFVPLASLARVLPGCDLLVSAIPDGGRHLAALEVPAPAVVLDADYRNSSIGLTSGGESRRVIDGRHWLLRQALLSFTLFNRRRVPRLLRRRLREVLDSPPEPPKPHVALIGFAGAGKTVTGRLLAERLGRDAIDTDERVETAAGRTIGELFRTEGEAGFRARERAAIGEAAAAARPSVLSIGGGGVLEPENVRRIRAVCRTVWLWVSPGRVLPRISGSPRPALGRSPTTASIAALLSQRLPRYAAAGDLVVNTDAAPPFDVAERILDEMR